MIELDVYANEQNEYTLQIPALDGTAATTFLSTDALSCNVWEGQSQATLFSPTVEWFQEVTAIAVTFAGSGYTSPPTVTISGGGATTDATAYAVLTSGAVTSIVMSSGGEGYDGSAVTVVISGGGGSGATGAATVTLGWQSGLVSLVIGATDAQTLTPGGTYRFQTIAGRDDVTAVVIDGLLKVIATPGFVSPSPPDLITYDFAEGYCSVLGLTDAQRDQLPSLVAAASMAVRRFCQDRNFDQRTYTEFHGVSLNGQIRLLQPPVQIVQRVQGQPALALTVSNTSTAVQAAQVYFAYTGVWQGYATNAQTPTGITLSSVSSGVVTTSTVSFVTSQTITALAVLINAVGGGWVATADSVLGLWPVTELDGGYVGQGAAAGAFPSGGAQFDVLQDLDLSGFRLDTRRNGFLQVGRQGTLANQWGPGGDLFWNNASWCGRVKVTYVGGETVIPMQVQIATAELVKFMLYVMKTDTILESETAQEYTYKLCTKMLGAIPPQVAQALAPFIIQRA